MVPKEDAMSKACNLENDSDKRVVQLDEALP